MASLKRQYLPVYTYVQTNKIALRIHMNLMPKRTCRIVIMPHTKKRVPTSSARPTLSLPMQTASDRRNGTDSDATNIEM